MYVHPVIFHEDTKESSPVNNIVSWQRLTWLVDDEVNLMLENPAERKHQKLSRSVGRGVVDMELKPDGAEKKQTFLHHPTATNEASRYGIPKSALEIPIRPETRFKSTNEIP